MFAQEYAERATMHGERASAEAGEANTVHREDDA
jgi:hypothetical protein